MYYGIAKLGRNVAAEGGVGTCLRVTPDKVTKNVDTLTVRRFTCSAR
jgi:hypothetical protein